MTEIGVRFVILAFGLVIGWNANVVWSLWSAQWRMHKRQLDRAREEAFWRANQERASRRHLFPGSNPMPPPGPKPPRPPNPPPPPGRIVRDRLWPRAPGYQPTDEVPVASSPPDE